jgi:hypothetical protein
MEEKQDRDKHPGSATLVVYTIIHILLRFPAKYSIYLVGGLLVSGQLAIFLIKNCNLVIPKPQEGTHKVQEKPSALKKEHPALQNMKILYFFYICRSFLPSWFRIQQLKLMRINADPDPHPCW